jgi:hypothetical protein
MEIIAFNKKTALTTKFGLRVRSKVVKCCSWTIVLCGAGTWTLGRVDQKQAAGNF